MAMGPDEVLNERSTNIRAAIGPVAETAPTAAEVEKSDENSSREKRPSQISSKGHQEEAEMTPEGSFNPYILVDVSQPPSVDSDGPKAAESQQFEG